MKYSPRLSNNPGIHYFQRLLRPSSPSRDRTAECQGSHESIVSRVPTVPVIARRKAQGPTVGSSKPSLPSSAVRPAPAGKRAETSGTGQRRPRTGLFHPRLAGESTGVFVYGDVADQVARLLFFLSSSQLSRAWRRCRGLPGHETTPVPSRVWPGTESPDTYTARQTLANKGDGRGQTEADAQSDIGRDVHVRPSRHAGRGAAGLHAACCRTSLAAHRPTAQEIITTALAAGSQPHLTSPNLSPPAVSPPAWNAPRRLQPRPSGTLGDASPQTPTTTDGFPSQPGRFHVPVCLGQHLSKLILRWPIPACTKYMRITTSSTYTLSSSPPPLVLFHLFSPSVPWPVMLRPSRGHASVPSQCKPRHRALELPAGLGEPGSTSRSWPMLVTKRRRFYPNKRHKACGMQ